MKPDPASLHIWPQCRACILGMIRDSLSMSQIEDNGLKQKLHSIAESVFERSYQQHWSSPVTANKILKEFKRLSGVTDPYAAFKQKELAQARKIFSETKLHIDQNLKSRVILSVLGNSLDFFTNPENVLQSLPQALKNGISFYYDEIDQLERLLFSKPKLVLFFTDNTGEAFFDIPLFHFIDSHAERTVLVVKGGPSLNDLSCREIKNDGLESYFGDIADTGTSGVGIDWDRTSKAFKNLVQSADLIISKGMANFETVYPRSLSAHVFFLLKAKCDPIQNYLGAPTAGYCAIWKEGIR
jgi:uncharacterized protein with ATP-grasp and redox domains